MNFQQWENDVDASMYEIGIGRYVRYRANAAANYNSREQARIMCNRRASILISDGTPGMMVRTDSGDVPVAEVVADLLRYAIPAVKNPAAGI